MSNTLNNGMGAKLPALTAAQESAVFAPDGPILADSVPGSGKTRTITCRLTYLVHRCDPSSILAITFTKAAAAEMSARVKELLAGTGCETPYVTHFHSFAYHLLLGAWNLRKLNVLDPDKQIKPKMIGLLREITGEDKIDHKRAENFQQLIGRAKAYSLHPVRDAEECRARLASWASNDSETIFDLWNAYEEWCAANDLLDFDDLLNLALDEINHNSDLRQRLHLKYRHVLVDEFQDTNPPQWALVRALVENKPFSARAASSELCDPDFDWTERSLLVTGDCDQSIYRFRAADVSNILLFPKTYKDCNTQELSKNYRSSGAVVAAANRLIGHNRERCDKQIETDRGVGNKIGLIGYQSSEEQTRRIARLILELYNGKRKIAVLSRHHDGLHPIRKALTALGIPHTSDGGLPFSRTREVGLLLRWLKASKSLQDNALLLAALGEAGESEEWVRFAREAGEFKISLWEYALWQSEISDETADFLAFLSELGCLIREKSYFAAVAKAIDRLGIVGRLAGANSINFNRLIDWLRLMRLVEAFEQNKTECAQNLDALLGVIEKSDDEEQIPVEILTVHASKGLEFDTVIISDFADGVLPAAESGDDEEERRLAYVAVTRAINRLVLAYDCDRPSRYLREMMSGAEGDFVLLD